MAKTIPQNYPRIQDEDSSYYGCLDDTTLVPHTYKIPPEQIKTLILSAINIANQKSSREILSIPTNATEVEIEAIYEKEGRELFKYFRKYPGDPASTAHQIFGKHYRDVGSEQFRNRTLQKERMNAGWRYQYLAVDCATHSRRFRSVSDIGAAEADFNATIAFLDPGEAPLSLYVSVKNRRNTMGGQDWPKAIHALEEVAKRDKNRAGPYCCIFGLTTGKRGQEQRIEYLYNTEIWLPDYFWTFFANYSYKEIMLFALDALMESSEASDLPTQVKAPAELLDSFGEACKEAELLDSEGYFNTPYKLVHLFCNPLIQ